MKPFQFVHTPNVFFGEGTLNRLSSLIPVNHRKCLILTGKSSFVDSIYWTNLKKNLKSRNLIVYHEIISGEPDALTIDKITSDYRDENVDLVIGIGGGSVLDAAKALAAMLKENEGIEEFLEGIGIKIPSGNRTFLIVVPTTSGTGSEATKNAVISKIGDNGYKKSLRHDNFVPDIAILDPELTLNCSIEQTATSGMDALSQLVESYLSPKASEFTDLLALPAIQKIILALPALLQNPTDLNARGDMSWAAFISGITLANAGLGTVHGFAQPLGSLFPIPHGIVCGTLMAETNRITLQHLKNENTNNLALVKYANLGRLINPISDNMEAAQLFIRFLIDLTQKLPIPRLGTFGVSEKYFNKIFEFTTNKDHPIPLSQKDWTEILSNRL